MSATDMSRDLYGEQLTRAVAASFDGAPDERVREVMQALVRHLHAFAGEVALGEAEWFAAIDFLTRCGQISDDKRQELILLSDVLGLSMRVVGINQGTGTRATEPTVFGPFFVEGSPGYENGDDLAHGAPGDPCLLSGRVVDTDGRPLSGALLEIWQADEHGMYDVQYDGLAHARGRGHLRAGEDGRWWCWSVKPVAYPIPDDGPVGELLAAGGRGPMRPAHVHFMVRAPGMRTLITHVFAEGDEYLDRDAVFGVRQSLVAPFVRHDPGPAPPPDGR